METKANDYANIPGWGIDADPKNDPTYPIRHRTDRDGEPIGSSGYTWERPPKQPVDIDVFRSIERPNISAVFGTSAPPAGLSGMSRRYAFRSSESEYGHWLPLLLADRVSVVEGVLDDLKQGHIPNIFAEKGWKAGWKYNRAGLTKTVIVRTVVTAAVLTYFFEKTLK